MTTQDHIKNLNETADCHAPEDHPLNINLKAAADHMAKLQKELDGSKAWADECHARACRYMQNADDWKERAEKSESRAIELETVVQEMLMAAHSLKSEMAKMGMADIETKSLDRFVAEAAKEDTSK